MIKSFANFLDYDIPPDLRSFIAAVIHGESESSVQLTYPVHAIGFPLLIHVYGAMPVLHVNNNSITAQSRLNIAGQIFNQEPKIEINGTFGQIGFVLYPTATYYLFHKPGTFFLNAWRTFEETLPRPVIGLQNELQACKSPIERVAIILKYLQELALTRLPPINWLDKAVQDILAQNGAISQEALVENTAVGSRHFRRTFKKVVGVAPKYFCKVIQLNTIFELLKSTDTERLHHMALDCGYYDQAHFINDFKKLIGDSPGNFLNGEHAYVKTYLGRKGEDYK